MLIIMVTNDQPVYQYLCTLSRLAVVFWRYWEWDDSDIEVCYA